MLQELFIETELPHNHADPRAAGPLWVKSKDIGTTKSLAEVAALRGLPVKNTFVLGQLYKKPRYLQVVFRISLGLGLYVIPRSLFSRDISYKLDLFSLFFSFEFELLLTRQARNVSKRKTEKKRL